MEFYLHPSKHDAPNCHRSTAASLHSAHSPDPDTRMHTALRLPRRSTSSSRYKSSAGVFHLPTPIDATAHLSSVPDCCLPSSNLRYHPFEPHPPELHRQTNWATPPCSSYPPSPTLRARQRA